MATDSWLGAGAPDGSAMCISAAGVGGDDDVDAGQRDEARCSGTDGDHDGAHDQRRGQVVGHRRQAERQAAGQPEQAAVTEAGAHQPGPQRLEHVPFLERFDVGHRDEQEQQQLGEFEQDVAQGGLSLVRQALDGEEGADEDP
jgi:hypothetical protein